MSKARKRVLRDWHGRFMTGSKSVRLGMRKKSGDKVYTLLTPEQAHSRTQLIDQTNAILAEQNDTNAKLRKELTACRTKAWCWIAVVFVLGISFGYLI